MEIDRGAPVWAERDVEIAAPIEAVWSVLASVEEHPRWFSLGEAVEISGALAPGATLRMKGRGTGWITATIAAVEQPQVLAWTSRTFGISSISVWRLAPSVDGTRVVKGESMGGLPVKLMRRSFQKKLESFMEAWLLDLKTEAERRTR